MRPTKEIIMEAFKEDDIRKVIDDPDKDINIDFLYSELEKKEIVIDQSAEIDEDKYVTLMNKRNKLITDISTHDIPHDRLEALERIHKVIENWFLLIGIILAGIIVAEYFKLIPMNLALITLILFVLALSFFYLFYYLEKKSYLKKKEASKERLREESIPEVKKIDSEISSISKKKDQIIYSAVLKEIRSTINQHLKLVFDTYLFKLMAPGLAEVYNPKYEIETKRSIELKTLIQSMDGGSIGIAGPRGAGKTILLRSICRDSMHDKDNLPILSILVSAPVEYAARDFILHLFATLCQKILYLRGITYSPHSDPPSSKPSLTISEKIVSILLRCGWSAFAILYFLSMVLLLFGIYITINAINSQMQFTELNLLGINPINYFIYGTLSFIAGTFLLGIYLKVRYSTYYQEMYPERYRYRIWENYFIPSFIILLGIVFILFSIIISNFLLSSNIQTGFLAYLLAFFTVAGIKPDDLLYGGILCCIIGLLSFYIYLFLDSFIEDTLERSYKGNQVENLRTRSENKTEVIPEILIDQAKSWLHKIRFQQSYSSGWSGTLKLPFGVEGGVTGARSLAENQMSLPEIVSSYIKFIENLSSSMIIIIGIDELDKLKSDENAERFLNEIKAIFGLRHVFYIISVSESAMSSFERRGFPFRDVFDSSFDKIISVDYLDQEGAKQLIWQRVIALPIPFLCLCYCMSGGLARDLIRICRNMLELTEPDRPLQLSEVSRSLIKSDLKAKLKAVSISAKTILLEPDVTKFLVELHQLDKKLDSLDFDINNYIKFFNSDCLRLQFEYKNVGSEETKMKQLKITTIKEELKIYFYFSLTLIDFFDETNERSIKDAFSNEKFNLLAKSRQCLAVSPCISQLFITLTPHHVGNRFNPSLASISLIFFGISITFPLSPKLM